jgi:hypothetical protein
LYKLENDSWESFFVSEEIASEGDCVRARYREATNKIAAVGSHHAAGKIKAVLCVPSYFHDCIKSLQVKLN